MKRSLSIACALAVVSTAGFAYGADLLDKTLGGTDGSTPAPTVAPTPPADVHKLADVPVAPTLVNPDAAKAVDDMDLLKKLTSGADNSNNDTGAAQQVKDMVDRMGQSQERLDKKDPGDVTQETQRRIVVDLDALIEIARKQCNSSSQSQSKSQGQPQPRTANKNSKSQGGSTAATNENLRSGGSDAPEANATDMHQRTPAEWGNLPPRDRDLLAHGSTSEYLPAYRALIDRYYQALADVNRPTRDH